MHRSCRRWRRGWRRDRRGGALPAVGQHRAGQKDGFAPPLFHDTQHSCASLLLRSGVQMKQIQAWLGHSDISTTANICAHLDSQSKQLSAATMEQALPLRGSCPKAGGKMGKRNPRGKPLGFWRSIRDLNSGGAVNALSHFECDLFDLLSNAPYEIVRQARRVGYRRSPTTPYYTKKFPARQEKFDAPGFYSSTISQCHSLSPAWIA